MATDVRRTTRARHPARDSGKELHAALLQLLKAIPVDHLDRRLTAIEKWVTRLQKDVTRLLADFGRAPRPHRQPVVATKRRARRPAQRRTRRAAHLPVEREMVHPGG